MRTLLALVSALLLGVTAAGAQTPPMQIGIDCGFEATSGDDIETTTLVSLPLGMGSVLPSVRFDLPISPIAVIEPAVGLSVMVFGGDETGDEVRGGLSLLLYPTGNSAAVRPYLRAGALTRAGKSAGESSYGPQFGFGGGVGIDAPFSPGGVFRFEGSYSAFGEDDEEAPAFHVFALRFGLGLRL
jgi:hypothetical protein